MVTRVVIARRVGVCLLADLGAQGNMVSSHGSAPACEEHVPCALVACQNWTRTRRRRQDDCSSLLHLPIHEGGASREAVDWQPVQLRVPRPLPLRRELLEEVSRFPGSGDALRTVAHRRPNTRLIDHRALPLGALGWLQRRHLRQPCLDKGVRNGRNLDRHGSSKEGGLAW